MNKTKSQILYMFINIIINLNKIFLNVFKFLRQIYAFLKRKRKKTFLKRLRLSYHNGKEKKPLTLSIKIFNQ